MLPLRNCKITTAGDLGDEWNNTNIARWCSYNGATYTRFVEEDTTHILATPAQYQVMTPKYKQRLQQKRIHVVTKDWFEDTITQKKKLDEESYSLQEEERKGHAELKSILKNKKGMEQAENYVNTNMYHVFRDETYFSHEITLTRDDEESGYKGQKYVLCLWESNAWPYLYQFTAKFYKKAGYNRPAIYRLKETPVLFKDGFDAFKSFFKKKTGIEWDERMGFKTTSPGRFRYQPPTGGKPVGVLPQPPPAPPVSPALGNSLATAAHTGATGVADTGLDPVSTGIQSTRLFSGWNFDGLNKPALESTHPTHQPAGSADKRKHTGDDDNVGGSSSAKRSRGEKVTTPHQSGTPTLLSRLKQEHAGPAYNANSATEANGKKSNAGSITGDATTTKDDAKDVDWTSPNNWPDKRSSAPYRRSWPLI